MKIGLVGLGKMGFRMAQRLLEQDFKVVAFDINKEFVEKIIKEGAIGVESLNEVVKNLESPRKILLSVPSNKILEQITFELKGKLSPRDIVIDLGNTFYKDSKIRAKSLAEKGIFLLDVGVSGGISGARNGACLMIGGKKEIFKSIEPLFKALSKNNSYKYLGNSGAGHLVKGYHNFVEYGYMQALAEGLVTLENISKKNDFDLNLMDVCDIWNRGSIVESRLVGDAKKAMETFRDLENVSGTVIGQTHEEMEKLVKIAEKFDVEVPVCKSAIEVRKKSVDNPSRIGKVLNAMRTIFGGHQEWKK